VKVSAIVFSLYACAVAGCGNHSPSAPTPISVPIPSSDFAAQFDSLWSTFDREYSYFDYKQIDWNALKNTYRPMATAAADQVAFMAVIREMLGRLHDKHVVVREPSGAAQATYAPEEFVNWDRRVWQQYIARAGWAPVRGDSGSGVLDGVPYISISGWNTSLITAAEFDAALERFRNAPVLILDVRMNGGGTDSIAFDVAGRFARTSVNTGSVRYRSGPSHSDFGAPIQRTLNPRGPWQFTGKVLLLVGRFCLSSNESFIEAMGQLPNVTVAGDRTGGGSASPATFPLAGGWSYTVSRWIEYAADGHVIEDAGISPRVFVPASAADFAQGRDPVIDWALAAAK
jgi:C-terminal processing protease CtpA/Prc